MSESFNEHRQTVNICDNAEIFKFLNPNSNDKLSNLNHSDLNEFLRLLDKYYLYMRERLGFDKFITFGLEIEFHEAMLERLNKRLKELLPGWEAIPETAASNAGEIPTPIMYDTKAYWKKFSIACKLAFECGINAHNCGGHIHVGANILGQNSSAWKNFILLFTAYEHIIFRFCYGELLTERESLYIYAEPLYTSFWNDIKSQINSSNDLESTIEILNRGWAHAVNLDNVTVPISSKLEFGNTIEFRNPNGSFNPIIWQNNLNLVINLLLYSKNPNFDDSRVLRRQKISYNNFYNLLDYRKIYLDQALELCDLIFTNNFDKVYFLRQYLKSFQIGKKTLDKAKRFTVTRNI